MLKPFKQLLSFPVMLKELHFFYSKSLPLLEVIETLVVVVDLVGGVCVKFCEDISTLCHKIIGPVAIPY